MMHPTLYFEQLQVGLRLKSIDKLLVLGGGGRRGWKLDAAAVFKEGNYSSEMLSDICKPPSEVTPAELVPSHLGRPLLQLF